MTEQGKQSASIAGILPVNKPAGISSAEVVSRIKRALDYKKIGHSGTLDPAASGVLLLLLGGATKIMPYLKCWDKEYNASAVLGVVTDTDDYEGKIISDKDTGTVKREDVVRSIKRFEGIIEQMPPVYSAKKYKGKPHYDYARQGIRIDRKPAKVKIESVSLISFDNPNFKIDVRCGGGTYIRALCRDIGEFLGVGAYMKSLIRTANGPFRLEDAHDYDAIVREGPKASRRISKIKSSYFPFKGFETDSDLDNVIRSGGIIRKKYLKSPLKSITQGESVTLSDKKGHIMGVFKCSISSSEAESASDSREIFRAERLFN